MNKSEQEYLKEISRLEEDKKNLLAEIENWKEEQKTQIKANKELNKTNENLNLSVEKQEEERGKDQEKINQLKERIKELTDQGRIKNLLEVIKNQEKDIDICIASEKKRKEILWNKDQELLKLGEYLKRLNELVASKDKEITNLEEWKKQMPLYQKKITDLENALINLAKQKISNNYEWSKLLNQLKTEWDEEKELILNSAERGRDEQAEEIVALETENMKLVAELEKDDKEFEEQDKIIFKKDEVIEDLRWQLKQAQQQKTIIGEIDNLLKPQPKNIPIMTERDKQIIQQAKVHLEPLVNHSDLRKRIEQAEELGTKEAYWDLHTDLRSGDSKYQQKLLEYFGHDHDKALPFITELAEILHGEYLENK